MKYYPAFGVSTFEKGERVPVEFWRFGKPPESVSALADDGEVRFFTEGIYAAPISDFYTFPVNSNDAARLIKCCEEDFRCGEEILALFGEREPLMAGEKIISKGDSKKLFEALQSPDLLAFENALKDYEVLESEEDET
jgi:hypothetical protein